MTPSQTPAPTFSSSDLRFNVIQEDEHLNITAEDHISRQQWRAWALKTIQLAMQYYEQDFSTAEISLNIVASELGRYYNHTYRHKDYATNILTFEYGIDEMHTLRADLVLCWPVLKQQAIEQHKTVKHHACHLLVHGILHAMGFDHEDREDAEVMEELEISILHAYKIENPYL
ncbi:rRNA maturation RNase YbeY [Brackiella oedipodis]|uniref:rRNA maturation RNase YbeY n=1 Tax=Brackiella oedipodis TaxID=124225 RepID=UPI000688C5EE|nr:rRNA maturation RNase YbeY [Brackiella oedipodis]